MHLYFTCASDRVEGFQGNPLQCSIVVGSELLYPSDANSYRYPDIAHLYIPTAAAMLFLYHRDPRHRKSPSVCVYMCVCLFLPVSLHLCSLCSSFCCPCSKCCLQQPWFVLLAFQTFFLLSFFSRFCQQLRVLVIKARLFCSAHHTRVSCVWCIVLEL